jgi:hypothetical protein
MLFCCRGQFTPSRGPREQRIAGNRTNRCPGVSAVVAESPNRPIHSRLPLSWRVPIHLHRLVHDRFPRRPPLWASLRLLRLREVDGQHPLTANMVYGGDFSCVLRPEVTSPSAAAAHPGNGAPTSPMSGHARAGSVKSKTLSTNAGQVHGDYDARLRGYDRAKERLSEARKK